MRPSSELKLEISDPVKSYEALTNDPRQFSLRLREVLVGNALFGDLWELETVFGVKIAPASQTKCKPG
jgi:hypothetical protein